MPSRTDVLHLFKQLLNTAVKFDNYNFREYSKRKIIDSFRTNKAITSEEEVTNVFNEGINELARLTRQVNISRMYTFDKLVVEPLKKHH